MTTPPPYGSVPGQPQGYPGQQPGQPAPGYPYPGQSAAPQPAYGAQPYGAQPYGAQPGYPAGYGAPVYGGPAPLARPGITTAAAVLAFIFGASAIFQALFGILIGSLFAGANSAINDISNSGVSLSCDTTLPGFDQASCDSARSAANTVNNAGSSIGAFGIILGIGAAIVAVLMIWGGVVLLSGKNGKMVVIASAIYLLLSIALIIATTFGFFYIFGLVLPILITVFTLNSSTKTWLKAKGGKSF